MHAAAPPEPLRIPSDEDAAALRRVLAAHNYTSTALVGKLGEVALPTRRTRTLPRLMRATAEGSPLDTLARLFLFGVPVPAAAVRSTLDPVPPEALAAMGLIHLNGGQAEAAVILYPYDPFVLVFDRPEQVASGAPADLVMGISTSTVNLANFTIRRPARAAMDLGCGSGIHALLATAHSERVWGVDLNRRAIAFARFGAALNGVSGRMECLHGDRFAPAAGRRFDLIVGNLPFVITPATTYYLYRDSGMEMDAFARSVARAAPEHLEEGGFCQLLCEWPHVAGEDPTERLRSWFAGTGCDAWVLRLATAAPQLYAEAWIRDTEQDNPDLCARLYEEWVDYYAARRIEAVTTGLIAMRRRSGRNWFWCDDWPENVPFGFGNRVLAGFACQDLLHSLGNDQDLLAARLCVPEDVRLLTRNDWTPRGWNVVEARLCLAEAPSYAGHLNGHLTNLLVFCDGRRTLREAAAGLAASLGVDVERVAGPCVPVVRQLVERGFLAPAGV